MQITNVAQATNRANSNDSASLSGAQSGGADFGALLFSQSANTTAPGCVQSEATGMTTNAGGDSDHPSSQKQETAAQLILQMMGCSAFMPIQTMPANGTDAMQSTAVTGEQAASNVPVTVSNAVSGGTVPFAEQTGRTFTGAVGFSAALQGTLEQNNQTLGMPFTTQTPAATTAAQAVPVQVGTSAIPAATQGVIPPLQTTLTAAQTPAATMAAQAASVQVGTSAILMAPQVITPQLQTAVAAAQTPAATTAAQAASVQVGTSAILMAPQVMTPPLQTTSAAAQTPAATTAAQAASVQIDTSAIPAATQGVTPPLQTTVAAAQTPAATTAAQAVLVQVGTSAIPVAAQGVTPPLQTTSTAAQTPAATTAAQAASVQVGTSAIPSATQGATPLRQTTSAAAQTPVATTAAQVASVQVGTSAIPVAAQGVTPPLQITSTAAQTPVATMAAQAASVQVGTSAIPSATQGATPQLQTASASAQTLAVATATQAGGTMFSQLGEQTIFAQGGQPSLESRYRDAGAFETTGSTLNQAMGQHGSVAATFSASVQKTDSLMDTTLTGTQTDSASTNAAPATGSVQDAQVKNILSSAVVQAQSGPISAVIFRQKTAVSFQNMILQDNGAIGSLAVSMQGAPDAQSGKMLSTSDTQATVLHPVAISSVPVAQGMAASSSNIGGQTSSSDGQNRKEERQTSTVPQTYAQSVSMQTVTQSSTPVQAQPAAEQSRMTTQVADAVKDAFANQRSELRVHLSPEDLGGITIKMVSQGGVLTVSIVADNHHTCQMLATGLDHLKSAIQSSGVPVQKAEVSYTQADNTGQTPNQQNQAGQNPQQHRRQTPQTFRQSQPNTSEQQEAGFASFVNLFA